jgi:hypothetical protein
LGAAAEIRGASKSLGRAFLDALLRFRRFDSAFVQGKRSRRRRMRDRAELGHEKAVTA